MQAHAFAALYLDCRFWGESLIYGERWRVLTRTQYSYFGEDGLLRRHLYRVDILGGAQGANYACDYRTIERIKIAGRRRVFGYKDDLQKVPEPVLVSIDLSEIKFE